MATTPEKSKSLESWIWDAACSIRGAKDAPKYSRAERDRLPKAARWADAGASVNDYILPLILCDVFDDELNRTAKEVGSRKNRSDSGDSARAGSARRNAFQLVRADHTTRRDSAIKKSEGTPQVVSVAKDNRVRFYLPLVPDDPEQPVWSVIRKLSDKIGEGVTTHMRAIARENPLLQGIIDRVDFNATTHGHRDLDADHLSNLIEEVVKS